LQFYVAYFEEEYKLFAIFMGAYRFADISPSVCMYVYTNIWWAQLLLHW